MRGIWILSLAVLVGSTYLHAQEVPSLGQEVKQLRKQLDVVLSESLRLRSERARLQSHLGSVGAPGFLETEVNALAEFIEHAPGATVKSTATNIDVFGQFRIRWGAIWDRNFGNSDGAVGVPLLDAQAVGGPSATSSGDDGYYLDARFQVGFDFQLSQKVSTHFVITSFGLFDNGGPAGTTIFGSAASGGGGFGSQEGAAPGGAGGAGNSSNFQILNDIRLYEGWIRIDQVFGVDGLSLTNGRQEIVLGNEFQFGNNEFFSGQTFDAARLTLERDTYTLDFIWAKMAGTESLNPGNNPYPIAGANGGFDDDELFAVYFTYTGMSDHAVDLYWIYINGDNAGSAGTLGNSLGSSSFGDTLNEVGFAQAYFHTFGFRLSGEFSLADGLDYNLEVAYQRGSLKDFRKTDVDGLAVEAELGLTFQAESRTRVYLRFLYAEGAHNGDSGYIPLFPERHAYDDGGKGYRARYGILNIIPMDNVFILQGGFTLDPAVDWSLGVAVLWATHDADLSPIGFGDDDIGLELDFFVEYRHSAEYTLGLGFGILFPEEGAPLNGGSFINDGGRDDPAYLIYLDARVKF